METSRISTIVKVLAKNGLGGALCRYGFAHYLPFFSRRAGGLPADAPVRFRKSMEELGGAFIKLGQLLSIRPDLIPQTYCDEFSKLLDNVPPENTAVIESVISSEFGKPASKLFKHIDIEPLGSASIAQVHKARTIDGNAVAVKVQRPHIAEQFEQDIELISFVANKLSKHTLNVNPLLIAEEFKRYTQRELNFKTEATFIEEFKSTASVKIPKVHWNLTTEKVLTMEYLDGVKLLELKRAQPEVAKKLVNAFLDQIFDHGVFHADLHPGNVLLLKNGNLALLDFGIVGHLNKDTKKLGLELYLAILERDSTKIAEVLLNYGTPSSDTSIRRFTSDITRLLGDWWSQPAQQRRVTHLMHQLFALCFTHYITMPIDTILLGKGMMTLEATAHLVDPNFNFVTYSTPKITALLKQQKSSKSIITSVTERSKAFAEALSELPGKTVDALNAAQQGRLTVNVSDSQFRHIGKDINLSSNRLSYALITAALLVSGALLIDIGAQFLGISVLSIILFTLATFFVIALLLSVLREGKPGHDNHERAEQ